MVNTERLHGGRYGRTTSEEGQVASVTLHHLQRYASQMLPAKGGSEWLYDAACIHLCLCVLNYILCEMISLNDSLVLILALPAPR